ncbi:MAG: hypothetical protein ABI680_08150 [Chthoniobacteraceae bacterium]
MFTYRIIPTHLSQIQGKMRAVAHAISQTRNPSPKPMSNPESSSRGRGQCEHYAGGDCQHPILQFARLERLHARHRPGRIARRGLIGGAATENIRSGVYPIMRPLHLISGNRPAGLIKKVLDFMTSAEGQECIKKAEFITIADSPSAQPTTR